MVAPVSKDAQDLGRIVCRGNYFADEGEQRRHDTGGYHGEQARWGRACRVGKLGHGLRWVADGRHVPWDETYVVHARRCADADIVLDWVSNVECIVVRG